MTIIYVERVLGESGEPLRYRSSPVEQNKRVETILKGQCQKGKISFEELRMGSRRGRVPRVRSEVAERLIKELGISLAGWRGYWVFPHRPFLRFCREQHKKAESNSTQSTAPPPPRPFTSNSVAYIF